ncbi:MFS transporter [Rothia uropygialis]|uniref:MFS transporter n=1 Tax=Kocuria sp. 36 TaxID=1415402 RepID=UPI00101CDFD3|nr:aromatic acid/H+ symport family MFS transporter [Kocuria sp. 36]
MKTHDLAPRTQRITNNRAFTIVLSLCWVAIFFDGIDTFMYGSTIPTMTADDDFHMTAAHAGNIGSFATFGMLVGALVIGVIADTIGRRWSIILCSAIFSVSSAGCALAATAMTFGVWRTIAGFGLGGLLPTAIAMVSEFAPDRVRNFSVGLVMTAHQAGGIVAPLLCLYMLPTLGWRSIYWVGVLPLIVLVPLVLAILPESPTFLVAKGRMDRARALAERFDLIVPLEKTTIKKRGGNFGQNFAKLFRGRNAVVTLLFWLGSFGGLLLVYGMSTWLPSLMESLGFDLGNSLVLLCLINAGGIVGTLVAGKISDKWGPVRVSMLWFFLTAVGVCAMGIKSTMLVTYVLVFVTGIFLFSAQIMIYAAVSHVFPTESRATALGLTTGMGRFGAVFGPWMGGQLFALGLEKWGFVAFGIFGVTSGVMMLLIYLVLRIHGGKTKEATEAENIVIQAG